MRARRDLSSEISWFNHEGKAAARPGRNVKAIEMHLVKFSMQFEQRHFTEEGSSLNSFTTPAACAGRCYPWYRIVCSSMAIAQPLHTDLQLKEL